MATSAVQKPRVPVIAWVALVLLPLTLFTPWLWVLAGPALIIAGIVMFSSWSAMRPALHEDAAENVDVLCMEGYEAIPELRDGLRSDINALIAEAPAGKGADPMACSCIKREGDQWVGVLRIRTTEGHSYDSIEGADQAAVAEQLRARVGKYRKRFPELTPVAEAHPECHTGCCHLGRQSLFYVERDKWRAGAKKARKNAS